MAVEVVSRLTGEVCSWPATAPAPSLDLCSESVHELPEGICPRRPYWVVPVERPDLRFPASCDAYRCPICGPRKAEQAAAVITWAIRQATRARFLTLTLAPATHQQRRQKVRNLRRWARAQGIEWEMGWAVEVGKQTGMIHVHGIEHGADKIDQEAAQRRWGAHIWVEAIKTPGAGAYTVKEALRVSGYTVKGATKSAEALTEHLTLNGGRPAHWSRGFLHGRTKREALVEVRREQAGGEDLTWRLVPAWTGTAVSALSMAH